MHVGNFDVTEISAVSLSGDLHIFVTHLASVPTHARPWHGQTDMRAFVREAIDLGRTAARAIRAVFPAGSGEVIYCRLFVWNGLHQFEKARNSFCFEGVVDAPSISIGHYALNARIPTRKLDQGAPARSRPCALVDAGSAGFGIAPPSLQPDAASAASIGST